MKKITKSRGLWDMLIRRMKPTVGSLILLFISACASNPIVSDTPTPKSTTTEFASQDPIELLIIGKRAYNSKRFDLAERALLESIKLSPSIIDSHLYLGNLYFLSNRYSLSREQYSKALKLDSSNLIARNNTMLIDLRKAEHSLSLLENTLQTHDKEVGHIQELLAAIKVFLEPSQKAQVVIPDNEI